MGIGAAGCVDIMNSQAVCGTKTGSVDRRNCYSVMLQALQSSNQIEAFNCRLLEDDPLCKMSPIICDRETMICDINPDCIPDTCNYEAYCEEGTCKVKECKSLPIVRSKLMHSRIGILIRMDAFPEKNPIK